MKRNILNFHLLSLLLWACLSVACSDDNELPQPPTLPEGTKAIVLNLEVKRSGTDGTVSPGTRAETEQGNKYGALNEDKIETVSLFFFNEDGTFHSQPQQMTRNGARLTVVVPRADLSMYENKQLKIVAIANHDPSVSLSGIRSLDELKAKVQTTGDLNPDPQRAQDKFLMDGMIDSGTVQWESRTQTYTVPGTLLLHRAAAKIRLRIREVAVRQTENGTTVDYTMEGSPEVKLVHYANTSSLIKGTPHAMQPEQWQTAAYRAMEWRKFSGYKNPAKKEHEKDQFLAAAYPFYAYENNWNDAAEDETYLIVKIRLKAGSGAAKPYYYRIPVNYHFPTADMTDQQRARLRRIERNHLYDVVSSISVLGSEDEGEPIKLEAHIAIQPWNGAEPIDGDIKNVHFLVVKEQHPLMPNITRRQVEYYSDLPVTVRIDSTVYNYYDYSGNLIKIVQKRDFNDTRVTLNDINPLHKHVSVDHPIPDNYVPFHIYFTLTQVMPAGEKGTPLSAQVHATQYPPKYVTGEKSTGYRPNVGEAGRTYADFRFHDALGAEAPNPITRRMEPQTNDIFYKITTIVNEGEEVIGDPTDSNGRTKRDDVSNRIVSPEFILASQHGLVIDINQYSGRLPIESPYTYFTYGDDYGPFSETGFPRKSPYASPAYFANRLQSVYLPYTDASDRCYKYFEGEYGMDGEYTEYYKSSGRNGRWEHRRVTKTFKYKGRWRMPTSAELKYIDNIQDAPTSIVKSILWGRSYWAAETGKSYNLSGNRWEWGDRAPVRCVFDTYKLTNKNN